MKKILVPTDFSDCAKYAMEAGFTLAKLFEAELYFLHVIEVQSNKIIEKLFKPLPSDKMIISEEVRPFFNTWEIKAINENVKLNTFSKSGNLISSIDEFIQKNEIDFVLMGSNGASGKQEYFIGSNTQKAIRTLHVPLFVIKQALENYSFKNIVFASGFDVDEKASFLHFLEFIKPFKPEKIHLLSINTSGWFGQPAMLMKEVLNDFKALCEEVDCSTHFYRDFTVDSGIRSFTNEIGADLIAISNRHRHPLRRIFAGSNVEALVNHCEQPVLSIDFKVH